MSKSTFKPTAEESASIWDTYLRFRWGGTFGFSDPIFGADVGFYMFRLPFYEMIQNGLTGLTFTTFLLISIGYISFGMLRFGGNSPQRRNWAPLGHVAILFLLFIGNWVWGYYLDRFELLYSTLGVVYGVAMQCRCTACGSMCPGSFP